MSPLFYRFGCILCSERIILFSIFLALKVTQSSLNEIVQSCSPSFTLSRAKNDGNIPYVFSLLSYPARSYIEYNDYTAYTPV